MKIFTFKKSSKEKIGICVDKYFYDLNEVCKSVKEVKVITKPTFFRENMNNFEMIDIINMGNEGLWILNKIEKYIQWLNSDGDSYLLRNSRIYEEDIEWLPPIPRPPILFGIGGNSPLFFRDKDYQIPAYPRGFIRPTNKYSIIGHLNTVTIPSHYSTMRTSAELGIVIGKEGSDINQNEALDFVWGYTLVNDMCSDAWKPIALGEHEENMMHEDLTIFTQRAATSYYSRSTDSFASIGPYIVTKEEISNPYDLMVWNKLSGITRERGLTQAMVNGIERTISIMSKIFTLKPGMIFHMGTMGIDGYTIEKDMQLKASDYFEIEYEKIGILRNKVNDERFKT